MEQPAYLQEIINHAGIWYLPGEEGKGVPGILKLNASKQLILELFGEVFETDGNLRLRLVEDSLINGRLATGKLITIICKKDDWISTSRKIGWSHTTDSQKITVFELFVGAHFSHRDELKFDSVSINFNQLEAWSGFNNIYLYDKNPDYSSIEFNCKVQHDDCGLTITPIYETSRKRLSDGCRRFLTENKVYLKLETDQQMDYQWYHPVIDRLKHLLTLFTGSVIHPLEINFHFNPNNQNQENNKSEFHYIHFELIRNNLKKIEGPDIHLMPLYYWKLKKNIKEYFSNWFNQYEKLKCSIGFAMGALYHENMTIEDKFLNFFKGLETYVNTEYSSIKDPKFENALEQLKLPEEYREYEDDFKGILRDKNRQPPKKLIKQLLKEIKEGLITTFDYLELNNSAKIECFAYQTVKLRNELIHQKFLDNENEYDQAGFKTEQLKAICMILFLRKIGIENDTINNIFERMYFRARWGLPMRLSYIWSRV